MACAYAQLAAANAGLSSLWMGTFDWDVALEIAGDKTLKPVSMLILGHSDEKPERSERKPIDDLLV